MAAFAEVTDVQARLDFALDEAEQTAVQSALDDLSDEARYYAGETRWEDPSTAPSLVKTIVAKAVARWARNMNGYVVSKAGDESVTWAEAEGEAGSASLSQAEKKLLRAIGSGQKTTGAFGTVTVVAHGSRALVDTYIAVRDNNRPIPFVDPSGW